MLPQCVSITKSPITPRTVFTGFLTALLVSLSAPVKAMIPVDAKSINAALVYGMKNQKAGLSTVLGNNWIENSDGALLNIYTPFISLAVKASHAAGLSKRPAPSDLEKARKRFARDIAYYSDTRNRFQVKFSVSFYGQTPDFAKTYYARITGVGRGKTFNLKPVKQTLDQIADPLGVEPPSEKKPKTATQGEAEDSGTSGEKPENSTVQETPAGRNPLEKPAYYAAINSYYFSMSDLIDLQEFEFVMESENGPPIKFKVNNERVY